MEAGLKIYHTSNSGLMIEIDEVKLLIDSLFQEKNNFNPVTEKLENQLFGTQGKYSNADCLLFTHGHFDHYDYQMTRRYMEANPDVYIAAPESVFAVAGWTNVDFSSGKIIPFIKNQNGEFDIKGVKIRYYRTPHLDFDMSHFGFHYSFVIAKENKKIFVSGDTKINDDVIKTIKTEGHITAAFFNPIVLQHKITRSEIVSLDADKIFIYHLPLEEFDQFYYRQSSMQMFKKHEKELMNVELLLGEVEEVKLLSKKKGKTHAE